jgi:uncharacterized membrane protein
MSVVAIALVVGVLAALASLLVTEWQIAPLIGWDVAALIYVGWYSLTTWPMTSKQTADHAGVEDAGRAVADLVLLAAAAASLLAVAVALVRAAAASGATRVSYAAVGVLSVVASWAVVHTTYLLRYARLYYAEPEGGIDFNSDDKPRYADFAYLAYTIGMTFQTSDMAFTTSLLRATALRHALLSYLFGTVIVATSINLVVALAH